MSAPIRYPFTEDGLREALTALGTTPQAVATNLSALGFSGKVNEPLCCPVANYLRGSISEARYACVAKDENAALFAELQHVGQRDPVSVSWVPVAVQNFVLQFDARLFPDLIDKGTF